jgi:hypothetical protein
MPDSSDIDNALTAKLGADAPLLALLPNLVHMDEAPAGATRFVIVSLIEEHDDRQFEGRAFEDALYLVKAVGRSTAQAPLPANTMKAAAARIDVLLDGGTLTIPGYGLVAMHREERLRYTEVDEVDTTIRWHHRGGRYRVVVSEA